MLLFLLHFRSSVESLQFKLSAAESNLSSLRGRVSDQEEEVEQLKRERDELRDMAEKSSAELRRALEVCVCCMCGVCGWCVCVCGVCVVCVCVVCVCVCAYCVRICV